MPPKKIKAKDSGAAFMKWQAADKLARLNKKKVPVLYNPKNGNPLEKAIYVTDEQERIIQHVLGHPGKLTKSGIKSYTDPSQSQGNTLSTTPTRTTSSPTSISTRSSGPTGGFASAPARTAPSSSGGISSLSPTRSAPSGVSSSFNSSDGSHGSGGPADGSVDSKAMNAISAAKTSIASTMTGAAEGSGSYFGDIAKSVSAPGSGKISQAVNSFLSPVERTMAPGTMMPGTNVNQTIGFADPRAGYYDKNGVVTPLTQAADELRGQIIAHGMTPNDQGDNGIFSSLQSEGYRAYKQHAGYADDAHNPFAIGSAANIGNIPDTVPNIDDKGIKSFGIAQWARAREPGAESFFKNTDITFDGKPLGSGSLAAQMAAVASEISGQMPGEREILGSRATDRIKDLYNSMATMTPSQAAKAWVDGYERPDPKYANYAERQKNAVQFAQNFPGQNADSGLTGIAALSAGTLGRPIGTTQMGLMSPSNLMESGNLGLSSTGLGDSANLTGTSDFGFGEAPTTLTPKQMIDGGYKDYQSPEGFYRDLPGTMNRVGATMRADPSSLQSLQGDMKDKGFSTKDQVIQTFRSMGIPDSLIAPMIGNAATESMNFKPSVMSGKQMGDNGTAGFMAQWRGNRLQDYKDFAARSGLPLSSPVAQAGFMASEFGTDYNSRSVPKGSTKSPSSPFSRTWNAANSGDTAGATAQFTAGFESPAGTPRFYKTGNPADMAGWNSRLAGATDYADNTPQYKQPSSVQVAANKVPSGIQTLMSVPSGVAAAPRLSFISTATSPAVRSVVDKYGLKAPTAPDSIDQPSYTLPNITGVPVAPKASYSLPNITGIPAAQSSIKTPQGDTGASAQTPDKPTGILGSAQDYADPNWKPFNLSDVPPAINPVAVPEKMIMLDPGYNIKPPFGTPVNVPTMIINGMENPDAISNKVVKDALKAGIAAGLKVVVDPTTGKKVVEGPADQINTLGNLLYTAAAQQNGAFLLKPIGTVTGPATGNNKAISDAKAQNKTAAQRSKEIASIIAANDAQMNSFIDRLKFTQTATSPQAPTTPAALVGNPAPSSPYTLPNITGTPYAPDVSSYRLPDITGTPTAVSVPSQSYLKDVSSYSGTQPTEKAIQGMSAGDQLKADLAAIKGGPRPRAAPPKTMEQIVSQPDFTADQLAGAPHKTFKDDGTAQPYKMGKVKSFGVKAGVNTALNAVPYVGTINSLAGLAGKSAGDGAVYKINSDTNRPDDPNAPKVKIPDPVPSESHGAQNSETPTTATAESSTSESGRPMDYYYWDIGYNVPKSKSDPKWTSYQEYLKTRLVK